MGKENTIVTGTTRRPNYGSSNNSGNNLHTMLPSSPYQFGIVEAVDATSREIIYRIIENNVADNKRGKAKPLYKSNVRLPDIGYVVPLLRGPDPSISNINEQYSKTVYYLDPIGIWQTVDKNIIERSKPKVDNVVKVSKDTINQSLIGVPANQTTTEQNNTVPYTPEPPAPSPSPSVPATSPVAAAIPPTTPPPPPAPTANYTFNIRISYDTWYASIYDNGKLIDRRMYVAKNYTEQSIKESLVMEGQTFGFYDNQNQSGNHPPQPDLK